MSTEATVFSVCRTLPESSSATQGLFVFRRIAAMASRADVRVIQPVPFFPFLRPLERWARTPSHEIDGVRISHAPMFYLPGIMKSLDGFWLKRSIAGLIARMLPANGKGIVDAHFGYPDGVGAVAVASELDMPVYITVRGVEVDYLANPAIRPILMKALNAATGIIAVSHSLSEELVKAGVDANRIAVIHNAVDSERFKPRDKAAAREALGISSDVRLVVSVGNLLSVKGHASLIEGFATLKRRDSAAHLVIIGGETHEPDTPLKLRTQVDRAGISDSVSFVGAQSPDDVARWLNAADAFALMSLREGCCNALLEALAAGVPSVVTNVGDNAYFVRDGANGFLVDSGDADGLAQRLGDVLGRDWPSDGISAGVSGRDWQDVAGEVLTFMGLAVESMGNPGESKSRQGVSG